VYVKALLEHGANSEAKPDNGDWKGETPLIIATSKGYWDIVDILLKHGAKVNAKDQFGKTTLMFASEIGDRDLCKDIMDKDPDIWAQDVTSRQTENFGEDGCNGSALKGFFPTFMHITFSANSYLALAAGLCAASVAHVFEQRSVAQHSAYRQRQQCTMADKATGSAANMR